MATHRSEPPTTPRDPSTSTETGSLSLPEVIARAALGGTLMGLANLVPGISGGTMLVVAGIFTLFIASIADVTSFSLKRPPIRAIIILAAVIVPAGLAILLLAGVVRTLVIEHRWVMYSLFIGWTLGGVPTVWAMAVGGSRGLQPRRSLPDRRVWMGAAAGLAVMAVLVLVQAGGVNGAASSAAQGGGGGGGGPGVLMFFVGGVAAAAAMVLPGLSGGYLLLLLRLYVPILDAIDQMKASLQARDAAALVDVLWVVVPLGVGVVVGIVGVSHLIRWLLQRFEKITMGVLLGLLLGAFLGLYPFQHPIEPAPGSVIKGQVVTREALEAGEIRPKDWPVEYFAPRSTQAIASLALIIAAASSTMMIARVGWRRPKVEVETAADSGP